MSFVQESKTTPIDNDTGIEVRADINRNMAALYSLNASSAEPSQDNSAPHMIWADTGNSLLKIRNANNDGFITIGTLGQTNLGLATKANPEFTGKVIFPAGAVGTPSICRTGDEDTGIYFSAADTLDVTTNGTRRAHFDSNGITIRDNLALRLRDTSNSNFVAIKAPSDVSSDITLTLPNSDGNANDMLTTDGSGALSFTAQPAAVPTGSVHLMATTVVPDGYLECDGSTRSRATFAALFAIIGTTWGTGDNSTDSEGNELTFSLPDLRGEFVRGWDHGRNIDQDNNDNTRDFATSQSSANKSHNHTATSAVTDPGHRHTQWRLTDEHDASGDNSEVWRSANSSSYYTGYAQTGISVATTVANDGETEARPRNIAMMYVIKT